MNGVSRLHSDLLVQGMFKDFYEFDANKFNNKTNGITQRRWLLKSNPRLSGFISETIGEKWVTDLSELGKLAQYKTQKTFVSRWKDIKLENKKDFADYIKRTQGVTLDPDSMFDIQVKRIHEYKRQLLFAMFMIREYLKLKNDPKSFIQPRTFMVGGKAAPGYYMAKQSIKFINNVAKTFDGDPAVKDKLKVVFLENYRVSLAEKIFPAAELSEQISTAGTEASGTGNMKFMLNGALTIGTLDGANVEMAGLLDPEDIFIFGMKTPEVEDLRRRPYNPQDFVHQSPVLSEICRLISSNFFSQYEPGIFESIVYNIFYQDPYMVCADFESYCRMQDEISKQYQDQNLWNKKSIANVAKSGHFSSDRTIREYAKEIWKVPTR